MSLNIRPALLNVPSDADAIRSLLKIYAADPMGGAIELSPSVLKNLVPGLQKVPGALVLIAWYDSQPAGMAVAFPGFSTFRAAPVMNLHDLAVRPDFRGQGIGKALLQSLEEYATKQGCCRVTLEVRVDNPRARALYQSAGYSCGSPVQEFWTKPLYPVTADNSGL